MPAPQDAEQLKQQQSLDIKDESSDSPTELRSIHTKDDKNIINEPQPEPSEADEFGLPTRPPRRRQYTLNDLDTPEDIKRQVIEETGRDIKARKDDGEGEGGVSEGTSTTGAQDGQADNNQPLHTPRESLDKIGPLDSQKQLGLDGPNQVHNANSEASPKSKHKQQASVSSISEWSHQQVAARKSIEEEKSDDEDQWQEMPAYATHRIYDDWGKVLAKDYTEAEDEKVAYGTLGGAGKGYTRVQMEEDAKSATSLDENTAYLFKDQYARNMLDDDDEEGRDAISQMQTTKELLTEAQRVAYVGVVRLSIAAMGKDLDALVRTKNTKKAVDFAVEAFKMWSQKVMLRLYNHMEIDAREQIMVEQLAEHGMFASDLTPTLMQNARVKNPNASPDTRSQASSARPSMASPRPSYLDEKRAGSAPPSKPSTPIPPSEPTTPGLDVPPPAYEQHTADQLTIRDIGEIENAKNIDLDIRWTILCDLFLLLLGDSTYDARSRTLLERVGSALSVEWQEICRFEKRVTDALEMQEQAEKENWNEDEHLEAREKQARNKRLAVMGLCTVGGGLVIGLSAGLLAPVIGAGLAAGFTAIGVSGTGTFLGGTGAAALIGTGGTLIGSRIGLKTSNRRTGAVRTYEYKPLFNNKRANLIVTVAGWMTGKVDDVRLPFSTIDPVMGDIYSVNWEPEMLQSTGQTIQILGTEALTQTIQQILGATILSTLMAGLSTPIVLMKISYLIDNPWTTALARGDATGLILADSIIDRNLGMRPITLVGFSLGSRVIFTCLKELARRGAVGLVQNVYMFGSPVVVKKEEYIRARSVVSGRFVNGYATTDWILGYLFRATSGGIMRVAGLASVDIPGIENIDVTADVPGHMAYRGMMPILLDKVGWQVESLEYTEIEDPDPENHEKRQRELINEIEEARKQLDEQPEKKGFKAFFSRKKAPQKKSWETYDERSQRVLEGDEQEAEKVAEENANVMFDVDAIRREALTLAIKSPGDIEEIKQHLRVKEIESTLPMLKVTLSPTQPDATTGYLTPDSASRPDFRHSQSYTGSANGSATAASASSTSLPNGSPHVPVRDRAHGLPSPDADDAGQISLSFESDTRPRTALPAAAASSAFAAARPPLRSVSNPLGGSSKSLGPGLAKNPWGAAADVDDPGFGREEAEMKMDFE